VLLSSLRDPSTYAVLVALRHALIDPSQSGIIECKIETKRKRKKRKKEKKKRKKVLRQAR
jgi:hypothetical protein